MIRIVQNWGSTRFVFLLISLIALIATGCSDKADPLASTPDAPPKERAQAITLSDIDVDEPVKKINRFQPLASQVAGQGLEDFGIGQGKVIIARDIDEMAGFLMDGTVDIYFDSAFPTLTVQEIAGSQVIARRWKQGEPTYWSTYIALRENGQASVDDFVGKVLAFEEPYSTSGFVLPAGTLVQQGFTLTEVHRPDAIVATDEIGYYFSHDEENTDELLLRGLVAGGGFSNQDYHELPQELKNTITSIDQTIGVPRQLVSVRPGLDLRLVREVSELLIGLDQTEEGMLILEELKQTTKFDPWTRTLKHL